MQNPTSYFDRAFDVLLPVFHHDVWWFRLSDPHPKEYGPFHSECLANQHRFGLFQRWKRAAECKGGWVWKQTEEIWVVTLPHHPMASGRALLGKVCSRHVPPDVKAMLN